MWQQTTAAGQKETLLLPVDGVPGRPLVHCDSLCAEDDVTADGTCRVANRSTLDVVCRDPENCECDGDNITDVGCANDNFGGSWLVPPDIANYDGRGGGGGAQGPLFVYVQGRRVSAFAPFAAGYDNLARVRRILVSWQTQDGLSWSQSFWGPPEPAEYSKLGTQPSEQYGASPFCYDGSGGRTVRGACRPESGAYDGSPLMAYEMPYDVQRQVFWMDLRYSTDGVRFVRVEQEPLRNGSAEAAAAGRPAVAVPPGVLGRDWNAGLIMGASGPVVTAQYTYAVMEFVDSGPHFAYMFREMGNVTAEQAETVGKAQFYGALLPSQWSWFAQHGGWAGVANLANKLQIVVGILRYRTGGLVCLRSTVANAVVVTEPVQVSAATAPQENTIFLF